MTSNVRTALPTDEEPLLDLLKLRHDEDGLGRFDESKVRDVVQRGLHRRLAVIGVIRGQRDLEASIGLFVSDWWDSSDEYLVDRWLFVAPQYRKSTHAKSLLEYAKTAATKIGRPLVVQAAINEQTTNKLRLYERQLEKPAGAIFMFVPPVAVA